MGTSRCFRRKRRKRAFRRIDLSKTFVVTKDENGELSDKWVPHNDYYKDKELKK